MAPWMVLAMAWMIGLAGLPVAEAWDKEKMAEKLQDWDEMREAKKEIREEHHEEDLDGKTGGWDHPRIPSLPRLHHARQGKDGISTAKPPPRPAFKPVVEVIHLTPDGVPPLPEPGK